MLAGFDLKRWHPQLVCVEDDGPFSVAWFKARGYEPIERYRLRDVVNWYFAPRDLAAAANARDTERGREERRSAKLSSAAAPRAHPLRAYCGSDVRARTRRPAGAATPWEPRVARRRRAPRAAAAAATQAAATAVHSSGRPGSHCTPLMCEPPSANSVLPVT